MLRLSDRFKRWKETYVVLHQNEIYTYTPKSEEMKITSKVLVKGCSVVEAEAKDAKRPFLFKMRHVQLNVEVVFAAASKEEMEEWITAIRAVVSLTCVPESRLKITQENTTLFKEFNAIVMMVDQIIQLLPAVFRPQDGVESTPESPHSKTPSLRLSLSTTADPPLSPRTVQPLSMSMSLPSMPSFAGASPRSSSSLSSSLSSSSASSQAVDGFGKKKKDNLFVRSVCACVCVCMYVFQYFNWLFVWPLVRVCSYVNNSIRKKFLALGPRAWHCRTEDCICGTGNVIQKHSCRSKGHVWKHY